MIEYFIIPRHPPKIGYWVLFLDFFFTDIFYGKFEDCQIFVTHNNSHIQVKIKKWGIANYIRNFAAILIGALKRKEVIQSTLY